MKFGLIYELQLPRPWDANSEHRMVQEALAEVEVADRLGFDYVWANEHHFLEEYSHNSAPEVFLAAAAGRTKQIHVGHAVVLSPPGYNPPARVAERIAMLDLVSSGRAEWGTGSSASRAELEGFNVDPDLKKLMWAEATEQTANMMAMEPYPGFKGEYFSMPTRNVIPKPLQKPHPPIWLACSNKETIHVAARNGVGALAFAFVDPAEAAKWAGEYYEIIKSDECVPIGHAVNANIAMATGFSVHHDEAEAIRRGQEGFQYFGFALGHHYVYRRAHPRRHQRLGAVRARPRRIAARGRQRHRHARATDRPAAAIPGRRRRPGDLRPAGRTQHARRHHRLAGAVRRRSDAGDESRSGRAGSPQAGGTRAVYRGGPATKAVDAAARAAMPFRPFPPTAVRSSRAPRTPSRDGAAAASTSPARIRAKSCARSGTINKTTKGGNTMRAAVLYEAHQPLAIENLEVAKPAAHEVLLRTAFTGLCHSDLHFMEGLYPMPTPCVLGHEASAVVEAVGQRGHLRQARRPCHYLHVGVLRHLRLLHDRPPATVRQHRRQDAAGQGAAAVPATASRSSSASICQPSPNRCWCTKTPW